MAGSRETILAALPQADSTRPSQQPETTFEPGDLWSQFEANLVALGGRLISAEALIQAIQRKCIFEPDAKEVLQTLGITTWPNEPTEDLWDATLGVSVADLAVAETGSVIVSAGPGRQRLSSLVPPANVMLVKRDKIVAKLADAIPLISSRSSAIITGPSRTADIEGILVKGVHGPGDLMVFIYD